MAKPVWTNQQIIGQLDSGYEWSGLSLTYGFPTSADWFPYAEKTGFSALTSTQRTAATLTVKLWDDLIASDFTLAADGAAANVKFMNTTTDIGYAHAYFPGGYTAAGSVWFNSQYGASSGTNNLMSPTVGAWGWTAFVHETGHALGLDHPGEYNGGSPTYANDALYAQDSQMYTLMSYFTASNTGADWVASDGRTYYAQTPMLHDIMAIQAMYGAETTTRTGNTVYGFNSTADAWVYDFTLNLHPVLCIWDSAGNDTLDLSGWTTSCVINLAPGSFSSCDAMTYNISIAYDCVVENGLGGGGADTITGNAVANNLYGLLGNDTLTGGGGNDVIDGGGGSDTVVYSGARANYLVAWNAATSTFTVTDLRAGTPDGADTVRGAEYFRFSDVTVTAADLASGAGTGGGSGTTGTAGADTLNGTAAADQMFGYGGNDVLNGNGGNDRLDGGTGSDTMRGGTGDDTYVVDSSGDVVVELAGQGVDLVQTTLASYTLGADVEKLTFTGSGNHYGSGNGLANVITGGAGGDSLYGQAGHDTLIGGGGNDRLDGGTGSDGMYGGAGNDTYIVDSTGDLTSESANEGYDQVLTSLAAFTLRANFESLTYTGSASFTGTGNDLANSISGRNGADVLSGCGGNDTLYGYGGNDVLVGGTGGDRLIGGGGADTFRFLSWSDSTFGGNADVVHDFSRAQGDRIDLSAIDARTTTGGNDAFTFIGAGAFSGAAGQLRYAGGTLSGDVDGNGVADFSITLSNAAALTAYDLVL